MGLFGTPSDAHRFAEFGKPLLSLSSTERFVLYRINWQGTDTDPTDTAEVSYVDSQRTDLQLRRSIRTHHDGRVVRGEVNNQTSLHHHLVTAYSKQITGAMIGPDFRSRMKEFSRRTSGIKLHDSKLLVDDMKLDSRVGSFDYMSVAEIMIEDRVATIIGPDGFLDEPMTTQSLPVI